MRLRHCTSIEGTEISCLFIQPLCDLLLDRLYIKNSPFAAVQLIQSDRYVILKMLQTLFSLLKQP